MHIQLKNNVNSKSPKTFKQIRSIFTAKKAEKPYIHRHWETYFDTHTHTHTHIGIMYMTSLIISERDKAFHKYKHDKCQDNFETFKSLRNHVQQVVYKAKKDFLPIALSKTKLILKLYGKLLKA